MKDKTLLEVKIATLKQNLYIINQELKENDTKSKEEFEETLSYYNSMKNELATLETLIKRR